MTENSKRPKLAVGDIVRSTAGRGSGRTYLVVETVDHEYVKICDGRLRKTANPKRKKNLHLVLAAKSGAADAAKLSDSEIRKILKEV